MEISQHDSSFITVKGNLFSKYDQIHLNITDTTAIYKQDDPTSAKELDVGQRVGIVFESAATIILTDPPTTNAKGIVILKPSYLRKVFCFSDKVTASKSKMMYFS